MMPLHLLVVFVGLLLPMLASCSSPPGRYQRAIIQDRDGVPCFTVPNTRETRSNAPIITGISVMEIGTGGVPLWMRDFLREGIAEVSLPPNQCLAYGDGGIPAPVLRIGERYQMEMWGHTPGNRDKAQARLFYGYFCVVNIAGKSVVKAVTSDCASTIK